MSKHRYIGDERTLKHIIFAISSQEVCWQTSLPSQAYPRSWTGDTA